MSTATHFFGVKGGQGVTVTACMFALGLARDGVETQIADYSDGDVAGVFGLPQVQDWTRVQVTEHLTTTYGDTVGFPENLVIDHGYREGVPPRLAGERVLVVRADYLSIRAAVRAIAEGVPVDRVVAVRHPGATLGLKDVEVCLGKPATVIEWDPSIARAVDAGLLAARVPVAAR